jgi:hypothetical protein
MKILTLDMKGAPLGESDSRRNRHIQGMVRCVDVACFQNVKVDIGDSWKFEGFTEQVCGMSNKTHVNIVCTRMSNWAHEAANPSDECLFSVVHFEDPFSNERLSVCSLALNPLGELGFHGQMAAAQSWIFQNEKMCGGPHLVVGAFHTPRLSDYVAQDGNHLKRLTGDGDAIALMDKAGYVDAYRLSLLSGITDPKQVTVPKYLDLPVTMQRYTKSLSHEPFRVPSALIATASAPGFRDTYVFASPAFASRTVLKSYTREHVDIEQGTVWAVICEYEWK